MATNIDTLTTYETIAAAGIEDRGARAISKAIAESIENSRTNVASKSDLDLLGTRLEKAIGDAQNKTLIWMFSMLTAFSVLVTSIIKLL